MKSLLLSRYKIHLGVDDGKLVIKDGRDENKEPQEWIYKPRYIDLDQIVLYGHTGNISLSAMKWLMKHKIPIHVLDYNGALLTSMNPPQSKIGSVKLAQYKAYTEDRIPLARSFINAKIKRSKILLDWVMLRYPEIESDYKLCEFERSLKDLEKASSIREIMGIEGIVARHYWDALGKVIPDKFEFEQRGFSKVSRPMGAVDPLNALFNYGYAILEGMCRRALVSANLDPYIGFLHEIKATKEPLVYDFQESFRWLVDHTIIQSMEKNLFLKKDFIRTDDYVIRIRPDGVRKLMRELDLTFSQLAPMDHKSLQWSTIINVKAQEMANYLTEKRKRFDLSKPEIRLERVDDKELRDKILNMSYTEWKKMGRSKGTLHYMKKKVREGGQYKIEKVNPILSR